MPDKLTLGLANAALYIRHYKIVRRYRRLIKRLPNIAHPKRYSERMIWRKLVDHNPLFVTFSDKLATKEYSRRVCPDLMLPRTLWVGNDADDIPDPILHGNVFVKTNHGFNHNFCIRDGLVDRTKLKNRTDRWLKTIHGVESSQWAYSMIQPRLFVEEAIGDAEKDLLDISIRAGNGQAILGSVTGHNKKPDSWMVYLDLAGNPTAGVDDEDGGPFKTLPEGIDILNPYMLAIEHTSKLSLGVDYARFDFMWNGKDLYGGEITVYPAAGDHEIRNHSVHMAIQRGWNLENSHFLTAEHTGYKRVYANALRRSIKKIRNKNRF